MRGHLRRSFSCEIAFFADFVIVRREFGGRVLDAGNEHLDLGVGELWRHCYWV